MSSMQVMERIDHTAAKRRKLIWDGGVRCVDVLYQFATVVKCSSQPEFFYWRLMSACAPYLTIYFSSVTHTLFLGWSLP